MLRDVADAGREAERADGSSRSADHRGTSVPGLGLGLVVLIAPGLGLGLALVRVAGVGVVFAREETLGLLDAGPIILNNMIENEFHI